MNTEDSEFARLEHEALLRASQPEHHQQHSYTLQERLAELHLYEEINEHYAKCNPGAENLRDWVAERMDIEPVQPAKDNMEIVGYQFQWTNPADNPDPNILPIEWETVIPAKGQTEQSMADKLLAYRYGGKSVFRVRALYAAKETV